MSLFADCRNDGVYNEDFLDKVDSSFLKGADFAVDQIENMFLNNLDSYEDELTEVLDEGEVAGEDEVYSTRQDLYDILGENKELIVTLIRHWMEKERDMLVTSMIDGMNEDEYKRLRKQAFEQHPDKEYYDTIKYAVTGKKVMAKVEDVDDPSDEEHENQDECCE